MAFPVETTVLSGRCLLLNLWSGGVVTAHVVGIGLIQFRLGDNGGLGALWDLFLLDFLHTHEPVRLLWID